MSTELEILRATRTVAVIGLSSHEWRPSYEIAEYLIKQGFKVIPINPREKAVLGRLSYPRLEDVPEPVDLVNIFRRPEHVPEIVEAAIRIGAKAIWMQPGTENAKAVQRAKEAGLMVVAGPCIYVEHRRLRTQLA